MRDILLQNGLSIQAQERYELKTATDQRGEQTINKDAKTAGTLRELIIGPIRRKLLCID